MPYTVTAILKVKKRYLKEFNRRSRRHANNSVSKEPGCRSVEVSVAGPIKDFQSTVNTVKTDLLTRDVNTRKAISSIGNAINYLQENPSANTITASVAAFTNEVKAEINGDLSIIGKGIPCF